MFKNTKKNIFVDESNKIKIISNKNLFSKLDKSVIGQLYSIKNFSNIHDYIYGFPDLQIGFGMPIGSAFAVDLNNSPIISPRAIGTDINCGVRLIRTDIFSKDITEKQYKEIVNAFEKLVTETGTKISKQDLLDICYEGIKWAVKHGYSNKFDKLYTDTQGCFKDANPKYLSKKAMDLGLKQLGTLGQGNHFIDLLVVDKIFDKNFCKVHKIKKGQIMIMLHTGSRGFGSQIANDYIKKCIYKKPMEHFDFNSARGQEYYLSMCSAANYAFVNRAILSHKIIEILKNTLNLGRDINPRLLYDLSHNIAKIEARDKKRFLVTRKGAVKCKVSERLSEHCPFQDTGPPIILPGSMRDDTYVLLPTEKVRKESFSTLPHGCGRTMSRKNAKNLVSVNDLKKELLKKGIYLSGHSENIIREENPKSYKSSKEVVTSIVDAKLCKKAFTLKPKLVITG